jgi:hypothetical protein
MQGLSFGLDDDIMDAQWKAHGYMLYFWIVISLYSRDHVLFTLFVFVYA